MMLKPEHARPANIFLVLIVNLLVFLALTRPVLAHTRVEVGPYVIVAGWENEPVIVGERNAVTVEVSEGDRPVEGLEATLNAAVNYAGRTFLSTLEPTTEPGLYKIAILPTVRGQYELVLTGTIEDMTINAVLEPEEVLPSSVLAFPEEVPDSAGIQAALDDLTDQLQTFQLLAVAGLLVGFAGLAFGVFALLRTRR